MLLALLVGFAVIGVLAYVVYYAPIALYLQLAFSFVWSTLTAPFSVHLFTVIYYRITDPKRPVIDDSVSSRISLWNAT